MSEPTLWIVDAYLPDYPVEFENAEQLKEMAGEHSQIIIYADKIEALEAARRFIRQRIRTMHDEGMEDYIYEQSRNYLDTVLACIDLNLDGIDYTPEDMLADAHTMRRESGRW